MFFCLLFNQIFSLPFGADPALTADYNVAINQGNNSFTCLDQSMTIPLSSLNDGKCDCPDGSDEPGTNACLNGHFYCANVGGKPKLIPSHKVNDGVCDCCDGSDESDNTNFQCANVCTRLVEMSHQSREMIYSRIRAGIAVKEESVKETRSEYQQTKKEIRDLHQDLDNYQHELDRLKRVQREKKKLWKIEQRQLQGISEEQYADLKRRKAEYVNKPPKAKPVSQEPDPHGLRVPFDENLNGVDWDVDEGVEEMIFHATPRPPPLHRRDAHSQSSHDSQVNRDRIQKRKRKWEEMQKKHKDQEATAKESLNFLGLAREKISDLMSKALGTDQPKSYKEYQAVTKEIEDLNNARNEVQSTLYRLEKKFKYNLGEENVWWPIAGKSFEISKDGSDYQLTIFEHMLQRQTGSIWFGTGYGTFEGFNATNRTMRYESGQLCYEGPPRRTEVVLYCGSVNKLLDMEEVDRCVYRAHFETPLCCNEGYVDWIKNMSDFDLADYITRWTEVE